MVKGEQVDPKTFLPRSLVGRVVLLALSACAIPFAGGALYGLAIGRGPAGGGVGVVLTRLAVGEFFAALFATGSVGIIWAVATPRWLPVVAWRVMGWMVICLLILWVLVLGMLVWPT
jgi:hypothetical protein